MNEQGLKTIVELQLFLAGSQAIAFVVPSGKEKLYSWIGKVLQRFNYYGLSRHEKGVVRKYIEKITGYSRQQLTRLIKKHREGGEIKRKRHRVTKGFKKRYTSEDVRLLAEMDELHQTPSGAVIKKLCERANTVFEDKQYERLSGISVSHLYNLRSSVAYLDERYSYEKTKPRKSSSIGVRRKPRPNGKPGYIRIDTVHQGDLDGKKGVYHINAVDEVTQFEVVCTVEKISEAYLIPILKMLLDSFPFTIIEFHSDNGSEFINQNVQKLLQKLFVEFTKSRSRRSNDNALVESKNASVVRKTFGYSHIPQKWAMLINAFNTAFLNPYVNYHRPCYFPKTFIDKKGKESKKYLYQTMTTPYEKLKSLENSESFLKKGVSFKKLDKIAYKISDNEAADRMNKAKNKLFNIINEEELKTG